MLSTSDIKDIEKIADELKTILCNDFSELTKNTATMNAMHDIMDIIYGKDWVYRWKKGGE